MRNHHRPWFRPEDGRERTRRAMDLEDLKRSREAQWRCEAEWLQRQLEWSIIENINEATFGAREMK